MNWRFWNKAGGESPAMPQKASRPEEKAEEPSFEPPTSEAAENAPAIEPSTLRAGKVPMSEEPLLPPDVTELPELDLKTCENCGADVEPDSKFCTQCAAPLTGEAASMAAAVSSPEVASGKKKVSRRRRIEGNVEPWAVKAGDSVSRLPRGVKIGVPVVLLILIAIGITLFVLAATHSPEAAVNRYLGELKVGDYKSAYEMIAHPGGRYSTFDYFKKWQGNTTDHLGRLQGYSVQERKAENKFFGKLIEPAPTTGTPFVATLKYRDQTFDVNITVEDAGGTWPMKSWRLKLTEGNSRLLVAPLGSRVFIDGQLAGTAEGDKELADALELKHFPNDIDSAVDYARKLVKTFQFLLAEFRRLAGNLEGVTESAQRVVDRFGTSGFTWSDLLDSATTTAQQSKEFGQDIARLAIHIYWIFGGSDDGSVRANLSRVQSGIDVKNLPEGWHEVSARLPGATPDSKEFVAPQGTELQLEPTKATERELKNTMNGYYKAVTTAVGIPDPAGLKRYLAGPALVQETNKVEDLIDKGQRIAAQLTDLRYKDVKLLNEKVATVETTETWTYTTYQGSNVMSTQSGQKVNMIYTIEEQGGGLWKVIERKQL